MHIPSPTRVRMNCLSSPSGLTSATITVRNMVAVLWAIVGRLSRSPDFNSGIDLMTRWVHPSGAFTPIRVPPDRVTSRGCDPNAGPAAEAIARTGMRVAIIHLACSDARLRTA